MPPVRDLPDAARQLEAMLVRQLLSASKAFKGSDVAGSQLQTDMFVEALADAVVKGGGLGIARMLERELDGNSPDKTTSEGHGDKAPHAHPAPGEGPRASTVDLDLEAALPRNRVSSHFGPRVDPLNGESRFHTGVDLRGSEGTPVLAAADGVVRSAGPRGGYGNAVEIDHGGGVTTLYGHASALKVSPGDHITKGQEVALVGATGRATGPHLHFEVRVAGRPVDPHRALNAYGIRADKTIGAKP